MDRFKLPDDSRDLLIHSGVAFESWLLERVCRDGRSEDSVHGDDFVRTLDELTDAEIRQFLESLKQVAGNPKPARVA